MKRLVGIAALTVTGCVLFAVAAVAALFLIHWRQDQRALHKDVATCPTSSPIACAKAMAEVWHTNERDVPKIRVPAALRYVEGSLLKTDRPPSAVLTFDVREPLSPPVEALPIHVSIAPAPSVTLRLAYQGGVLRRLPSGRPYLDLSKSLRDGAGRDGPFVERVGAYEIYVELELVPSPESEARSQFFDEHTLRLQLLNGVYQTP